MKKNFFKKLSFVLALAMIIATIAPAAGAFAATALHLNSTKRYLYLGGVNEFDFNISHATRGSKAAWLSSDVDVAEVDETTGLVTGTGLGTATISVDVTAKDGTVTPLEATVVVRDNIDTINTIYCQTDAKQDLNKLQVGKDYDFGRTFTTDAGSTTATSSKTVWTVNSAKATISTLGVFKATEAGDYTITALAFQSTDKANAWKAAVATDATSTLNVLASKTLVVKVVNELVKVEQVNATTAKVTFASPITNTADLTVSTLVAATSTKIKQTVKKVTLSDDKKVATVEMYANFAAGTTYTFDFAGITADKSFVGATSAVADVASIAVTTTTLVADATAHNVVVGFYNAAGVELSSLNPALLGYLSMTSTSEKVYANGQQLTFFTVGDSTVVTATYHTYTYNADGTEKGVLTATGTVTGVAAAAAASVSSLSAYTISNGTVDFSKANTIIAAEDNGFRFYAQAVKTDGTSHESSDAPAASTGWRFSSSDPNTLIVASNGVLYPVKAGVANVLVEYCANTAAGTPVWTVIGAPSVTVSAKRVATQLNLDVYAATLSNTVRFVDSKTVTAEVKDQYGVVMATKDVTVTENVNTIGGVDPIASGAKADGTTTFTFVGSAAGVATAAGTYTYAIKANGLTKYVVVNVQAPSAAVSASYQLSVGSSYDEKITGTTVADITASIEIIGYAANGVAFEKLDNAQAIAAGLSVNAYKPSGADNTILVAGAVSGAAYNVTLVDISAAPSAKLAVGTYTFRLYKSAGTQLIDTKSFTVTDTQPKATATNKALVAPTGTSVALALLECFDVKDSAGTAVTSMANITVDYLGANVSGSAVYIKNINLTETIGGGTVVTSIPVNTLITLH